MIHLNVEAEAHVKSDLGPWFGHAPIHITYVYEKENIYFEGVKFFNTGNPRLSQTQTAADV